MQCRFNLFIVLLEIRTAADMFKVCYGIILLIFGMKKMGIKRLSPFVYKCIRYKNQRRVTNIGVACKSHLEDAGHARHGLTLPLPGGIFQLRDFLTRGVRTMG